MSVLNNKKSAGWLISENPGRKIVDNKLLTYFQPSGVLQHSQYISATACNPVRSTRSSALPCDTLTLKQLKIELNTWKTRFSSVSYEKLRAHCVQIFFREFPTEII